MNAAITQGHNPVTTLNRAHSMRHNQNGFLPLQGINRRLHVFLGPTSSALVASSSISIIACLAETVRHPCLAKYRDFANG